MKILVAEDDRTTRELLLGLLEPYGKSDFAFDGIEAIEKYQDSLENNKPYDLVCLDIKMPRLDGIETLKAIREMEDEKGVMPGDGVKIIMVTVMDDSKNILGAFNEQCEAYIVKPVQKDKLYTEIKKLGLV